jgi:type I restriction enzyme S subunit
LNQIFSQKGDGWVEKKLGEVAKTTAGGTPLKSHKEYYENGLIPWLRSGEVGVRKITENKMFITELGLENSSAKLVPKNSVMIAMYGATAGEVGVLKFKSSTNQAVCAILPNDKLKPEFLYYFFLNEKENLVSQAVGNAQPNISQQKIKNTLIPFLSIELQEKIVGQLDNLISQTQSLESNYQQELNALDELKKSILQKAFNGEL